MAVGIIGIRKEIRLDQQSQSSLGKAREEVV